MDFRILGPLEVTDEGREPAIASGKQRALLAILLLHANEVISSDRLIEELWGEQPPATAAKSLQVHVSRLRKALGGAQSPVITGPHGYSIRVAPGELEPRALHAASRGGPPSFGGGRSRAGRRAAA